MREASLDAALDFVRIDIRFSLIYTAHGHESTIRRERRRRDPLLGLANRLDVGLGTQDEKPKEQTRDGTDERSPRA